MDSPSSQTTSRFGGAVGAVLLVAVLFVLALGVYGAVYMNALRPASTQPVVPTVAMAPTPPAAPATPAATVPPPVATKAPAVPPSVAISSAPALARINPAASRGAPVPLEAAKPSYWVEYGAYDHPFYATKLVARLSAVGIRAKIKQVQAIGGRRYYSVRATEMTDRSGADRNLKLAAAQIGIAPLIHRGGAPSAKPVATRLPAVAGTSRVVGYWVQFGAYDRSSYAVALRDRLNRAGITVKIVERHVPGQARYLVRATTLPHRDAAHSLAARGGLLLGIVPLVGQAPRSLRPPI